VMALKRSEMAKFKKNWEQAKKEGKVVTTIIPRQDYKI
jgi:hypothetical protein